MSKEYGLIIPNKNKMVVQAPGKRAAIFDEDSDSDEAASKPVFLKPTAKKQIKITQEKAIEEDPTVYQYDEIYDDMEKKRKESKLSKKDLNKKPKYITNLLKAADRRKRDNERRIERQVQKEREAEGDEFKDKESYVTPSYLKKLEEMRSLEEKEKREEYLESIGDVTKQGNLDGFYRHLYDQKVNYKVETIEEEREDKPNEIKEEINSDNEESNKTEQVTKKMKKRQYRTREESSNEEEEIEIKKEHIPSNLDADSDFSIDSSDSEDEKLSKKTEEDKKPNVETTTESEVVNNKSVTLITNQVEKKDSEEKQIKHTIQEKPVEKKVKIDIWKKRTIGEAFENARKRYFERRSLRESG